MIHLIHQVKPEIQIIEKLFTSSFFCGTASWSKSCYWITLNKESRELNFKDEKVFNMIQVLLLPKTFRLYFPWKFSLSLSPAFTAHFPLQGPPTSPCDCNYHADDGERRWWRRKGHDDHLHMMMTSVCMHRRRRAEAIGCPLHFNVYQTRPK